MNFRDPVVVQADGLADGILGDFESAIQIPPQCGFEIKPNRETERLRPQSFKEISSVGGLMQDGREVLPNGTFVLPASGGEDTTTIDGSILMIDTWWQGQHKEEFLGIEGIAAQIVPIRLWDSSFGAMRRAREQH